MYYQILVYTIPEKNVKKSNEKNKFKTTASTCNHYFELPDR